MRTGAVKAPCDPDKPPGGAAILTSASFKVRFNHSLSHSETEPDFVQIRVSQISVSHRKSLASTSLIPDSLALN